MAITSVVGAGQVVTHPILDRARNVVSLEAKQAWTDVAQLTELGVFAVNFGPGQQSQAHRQDECVYIKDMIRYEALLHQLFIKEA